MNNVTVLGIDLVKDVFQLHAVNAHGKKIFNKKISRSALPEVIINPSNGFYLEQVVSILIAPI